MQRHVLRGLGLAVAMMAFVCGVGAPGVEAAAPTASEILHNVSARMEAAKTASLKITVTQFQPDGSKTAMAARILVDRTQGLTRVTLLEPPALADQVMVLDAKAKVSRLYLPVTNQIIVSPLDIPAGSSPTLGFGQMFALPSSKDFDLRLLGTQTVAGRNCYVVEAKPKHPVKAPERAGTPSGAAHGAGPAGQPGLQEIQWEGQTVRLFVDSQESMLVQVDVLGQDGKVQARIAVSDLKMDVKLTRQQLAGLPADAEIVQR